MVSVRCPITSIMPTVCRTRWSTPWLARLAAWSRCACRSPASPADAPRASTYPLVSLSVRAQVETKKGNSDSTIEAAKKVIQRDGISGLYDGLSSSLGGIAVTNGVFFFSWEAVRAALITFKSKNQTSDATQAAVALSTAESMLGSAIAGAATSVRCTGAGVSLTIARLRRTRSCVIQTLWSCTFLDLALC